MTGVSTLGQAMDQIERIKEQQTLLTSLSMQVTSGKKTQNFSGLGTDVLTSKRARADFKSLETYIDNIKNADRRINLMTGSLKQFKKQAEDFLNVLNGFLQQSVHQQGDLVTYDDPLTSAVETTAYGMTSAESDEAIATLQSLASNIFGYMSDLMNTKDGDQYLFGGAETSTPPFSDSGTLDSALSSLLTQWKGGGITTDGLISDLRDRTASAGNPDAITDTIIGYSAALSAGNVGRVFVRIQQNSEINYTTLANDQAMRDIMVAVSYFKNENLTPIADVYEPPNTYPGVPDVQGAPGATLDDMKDNFYNVFNELTSMVSHAIDRVDQLSYNLENARARITQVKESHIQDKNVILNTIGDVEDVDLAEVSVKLNAMQTQIEASMAVTARIQQLSLVNFLFGN